MGVREKPPLQVSKVQSIIRQLSAFRQDYSGLQTAPIKVTIIIPAFNEENYLEEAVNSVFETNCPDFEILIVDDHSKDRTVDIAKNLVLKNPEVIRLFHTHGKSNKGVAAARNLGIKNAKGDVIAFLDADDLYNACRFDESLRILDELPEVDGVYEKTAIKLEHGGDPVPEWAPQGIWELDREHRSNILRAVMKSSWHTDAITLRKSAFSKAGIFNTRLTVSEDIELWMRMAMTCVLKEGNKEHPVALYRRHSANRVSAETTGISLVPALGYAIQHGRKLGLPSADQAGMDNHFEAYASYNRLGWLIENQKLSEAWLVMVWRARLYPKEVYSKKFAGNLKNLLLARSKS